MTTPTKEELLALAANAAEEAATRAVNKTLLLIGIDPANPLAAQRDFATLREVVKMVSDPAYRKDWEHVRWWREFIESVKAKGALTAIGALVTGLGTAVWLGLQEMMGRH